MISLKSVELIVLSNLVLTEPASKEKCASLEPRSGFLKLDEIATALAF
jgi:hypothetical protein